MKKWIVISILCLTQCAFAGISLVQRTDAGTVGNPITVHFNSNTQAGSLLILTASATIVGTGSHPAPTISLPSTSGFTWTQAATSSQVIGSPETAESVYLFFIARAPPMSSALNTSVSATISGSGSQGFGVQMVEYTGVQSLDLTATASGVGPTIASAGNVVTRSSGLIICFVTDPNFDTGFSAGSGYTLISTGGVGTAYGANEYQITSSPGSYGTTFGGTPSGAWTMLVVAFSPTALRHGGSIF